MNNKMKLGKDAHNISKDNTIFHDVNATQMKDEVVLQYAKGKYHFSPKEKANFHVNQIFHIGISREIAKKENLICSLGTRRTYASSLTVMFQKIQSGEIEKAKKIDVDFGIKYLTLRSNAVSQKTLDVDRLALTRVFSLQLPYIKSTKPTRLASRIYSSAQIGAIAESLSTSFAISIELCYRCGLRAHELFSLRPIAEQRMSDGRDWRREQFSGTERGRIYTVVGKGGLVRPIKIPIELVEKVEKLRLRTPIINSDRGIFYKCFYALEGGQQLSQAFSFSSKEKFGWTRGLHGLRHTYAQDRMRILLTMGFDFSFCLGLVSRELGHYRPEITLTYLR